MSFSIRKVGADDFVAVLELNEAVVPAVNSVPLEKMRWFAEHAAYFRVAKAGDRLAAFLIGLRPGTDYESANYRWFCSRYDDFGYIDRIAVAGHARRSGLASTLYDDFRASLPKQVTLMTCEVNLQPPNEASMRFHERLGFRQVGAQDIGRGDKRVAMMVRQL